MKHLYVVGVSIGLIVEAVRRVLSLLLRTLLLPVSAVSYIRSDKVAPSEARSVLNAVPDQVFIISAATLAAISLAALQPMFIIPGIIFFITVIRRMYEIYDAFDLTGCIRTESTSLCDRTKSPT
jgi:hypothetical protein